MNAVLHKTAALTGAALLLLAGAALADSGSFTMKATKADPTPVGDKEGHVIYQGEARGMADDGREVLTRELVDITHGTGEHQGYTTFTQGSDQEIIKWWGRVETTLNDGVPNTTFGGNWTSLYGSGEFEQFVGRTGTYQGYFTSPTDYVVEWQDR